MSSDKVKYPPVKRNILLNPGPATTTDTVKYAQVVPDICPREKEFCVVMEKMREDIVKICHGDLKEYVGIIFCGSGTLGIDACLSSFVDKNKQVLIINNGLYSTRGVEVLNYYNLPYIELKMPSTELPDLNKIEEALKANTGKDAKLPIGLVYITHHETGNGLLNPIREIGALAHKYGAYFITDTTSSYAMIPIDIKKDNIDALMASSQKGIMAMTGADFIIAKRSLVEESKNFPKRSYYTNIYRQYYNFETTKQMHFTPPVQIIYAAAQGIKEYFEEGEQKKWERHKSVMDAIHKGEDEIGLRELLPRNLQSGLVSSVIEPDDPNWNLEKVHDYCYERGYTIYLGKTYPRTFRLCSLGAIYPEDIENFWKVFKEALNHFGISTPLKYN